MGQNQGRYEEPKKGERMQCLIFFLSRVMRLLIFMLPALYFVFLRCPLSEVDELAPLGTERSPGIFLPCGGLFTEGADDLHLRVF